ncbi:hypothetical protein ACEWY4_006369 [Coilia grayii]|uniref:Uncharacterized protein n=1 Tax=Coilia grayii TaxID=363190 RepID=A0ABD1KD92_9TELE
MSESVSDFQAQVASVMDVLLKTAVKEITKLFEERYNALGRCIAETETVEKPREISLSGVRSQLESALKYSPDKSLCSVGVQVGKEWTSQTTEAPPLQLPRPLAHTQCSLNEAAGDSSEAMEVVSITDHRKEEALETVDLHCTVDLPCTALQDGDGESGTSQSNIPSGKQQPEQSSPADAPKEFDNVFDYLRKTLGWSEPHPTADIPEPAAIKEAGSAENKDHVADDNSQPETPTSTSTSQSDQSVTSSCSVNDPATPVQVGEPLPVFREVMHFQLGVDPRDWKLLQPCSVQLVDMRLLAGSRRMAYFIEKCLPKSQLKQLLTCPVCQDIFMDPRQLPCGHSLCLQCLEGMLASRPLLQPFCCPNCRAHFGPLIGVHKSYTLHSIVEDYNTTSHEEEKPEQMEQSTQTSEVGEPANYVNNRVLFLLLGVSFISIYYAFICSVENHMLTEKVHRQHSLLIKFNPDITDLTLNKDTASPYLHVSDDLLTVRRLKDRQYYPPNPSRFTEAPQVLSNECVSRGSHYWEVEPEGYWDFAVAYKNITTRPTLSAFGKNEESWSLTHDSNGRLFAWHAGVKEKIHKSLTHKRVGVVVDFQKGIITFNEVGSMWNHLHTFKANLNQPVCLGLGLFRADLNTRISVKKTFA